MKMRCFIAASAALMLALLFAGTASAAGATAVPSVSASTANGQSAMNADKDFGYYIWFDGDHLSLRTTDRGNGPSASEYTGKIVVHGGDVRDVNVVRQESDDWAVASDDTIDFHFKTYNGVDGVDFRATGAEDVTFHLFRKGEDGRMHLISTDHIFLGAGQVNPPGNPFTLIV
jgi:hypothetical protein